MTGGISNLAEPTLFMEKARGQALFVCAGHVTSQETVLRRTEKLRRDKILSHCDNYYLFSGIRKSEFWVLWFKIPGGTEQMF